MPQDSNHLSGPEKKGRLSNLLSFFHEKSEKVEEGKFMRSAEKTNDLIVQSDFISRDLSWLKFNERVLDQARDTERNLFDRLKFLAITASNLDEFFSIRVGSLYNYLDYGKERVDYSGLREVPFRKTLMKALQGFVAEQNHCYKQELLPLFEEHRCAIATMKDLTEAERSKVGDYFDRTI